MCISEVLCVVNELSAGSVIVDFSLSMLNGVPGAADLALQDIQASLNDGSLNRLAGAPIDTDMAVSAPRPQVY